MSKKKNKAATPKEPITRRDLCVRIDALKKENAGLRSDNQMLSSLCADYKATAKKGIDLAEKYSEKFAVAIRIKDKYRKMNRFLIAALILSGLSHLIYLFI